MEIIKEVAYTQAHGCRLCIQIGSTAYLFGKKKSGRGPRIEIFTPLHWFRWSSGYSK